MAKKVKKMLEVSLVNAELTSLPERKLLKSRNLVCVDMIWPRAGIARKSAAREATFRKGKVDFSTEEWAKRVVFREDVEARTVCRFNNGAGHYPEAQAICEAHRQVRTSDGR